MAMSLAAAAASGSADCELGAGNENNMNDLHSSLSNIPDFHCFNSLENDGLHLAVPPPPPTSPESSHSNQTHDSDFESEMPIFNVDGHGHGHGHGFRKSSQSLDLVDEEIVQNNYGAGLVGDSVTDMDRDHYIEVDEDEDVDEETRRLTWRSEHHQDGFDLDPYSYSYSSSSTNNHSSSSSSSRPFIIHSFVSPMVSPPAPPATPTNLTNTCKALIKFEFPELPKLTYQFVDRPGPGPAELQTLLSVEEFKVNHTKSYSLVPSSVQENLSSSPSPSSSSCTALIPYEQRDVQNKSILRNSWRKALGRKVRSQCFLPGRLEYNERRFRTAANTKNISVLSKLIEAGVDPNAADELGRTALHIAACKGFTEVIRTLLQSGANPNRKDCLGNTPLHLAACTNHFDVVTCLLRAGTDVSTLDNNGRNPLQLAQSKLKLIASNPNHQQPATEDARKIKMEVQQIIEMMSVYLQKKGQDVGAELLNAFATRLTLSQTPDEVDADVKNLLANLSTLTLTDPLSSGSGSGSGPRPPHSQNSGSSGSGSGSGPVSVSVSGGPCPVPVPVPVSGSAGAPILSTFSLGSGISSSRPYLQPSKFSMGSNTNSMHFNFSPHCVGVGIGIGMGSTATAESTSNAINNNPDHPPTSNSY